MSRHLSLALLAIFFCSTAYAARDDLVRDRNHHGADHDVHLEKGRLDSAAGYPGRVIDINHSIQVNIDAHQKLSVDHLTINVGNTIRFIIANNSAQAHEFAIGSQDELREYAALIRDMPNMKHDQGNVITLAPGQIRMLIWTFDRVGAFEAGCNLPGHFEAGMNTAVSVQ